MLEIKSFIKLTEQERVIEDAVCCRGVDRASRACQQASRQVLPLTQSEDHLTLYWFHSSVAKHTLTQTHTHKHKNVLAFEFDFSVFDD